MIGWLGSVLLALCGIPQAWQSAKQGHSRGISAFFLAAWFAGELLTLAYVWPDKNLPLIVNYSCNIGALIVIIWFKLFPRVTDWKILK